MLLSRITIFILSVSLLSSCAIPGFKNQNIGNNPGYNESQKTDSGTSNTIILLGSNNTSVTPVIETNQIALNSTIIKTPPVTISTSTVNESEKDDCVKKYESLVDQQNCTDNFYIKKALASKDGSICAMVVNSSSQDNCKDNVLLQEITIKNDATLCKEIKNPDITGNCYAIVGRQKQSQDQKIAGQGMDLCIEIADTDIKSACIESAIFNEAVRIRDMAMCKTLTSDIKQGMCASLIKSILENSNLPK